MAETILNETNHGLPATGPPDDPYYPAFLKEAAAYEKMLPELLKTVPGIYVAVYDQQVIDQDRDELRLLSRIRTKYPKTFVLICQVGADLYSPVIVDSLEGST